MSRPTGPEPVNAIVATPGWRTSAAPASPAPGSRATAPAGTPASRSARTTTWPQAGRLLGGLEDDGVAGGQAGGHHPHGDGDREVPRGDDGDHAARRVVQLVALAGHLEERLAAPRARPPRARRTRGSRSPRRRRRRPRPTASRTRAPRAPRPRPGARAATPRPPPGARRARAAGSADQAGKARRRRVHRGVDVVRARRRRHRDDAVGIAGVGRDELVALAAVLADPDRQRAAAAAPVDGLQPGRQLLAHRRAAQLEDGLVGERRKGHQGAASSSSSGRPVACSWRKDSLEVFSSRRRTRYAIPPTRSPTGQ